MGRKNKHAVSGPEDSHTDQESSFPWAKLVIFVAILILLGVAAHYLLHRDRTLPRRETQDSAASANDPSQTVDEKPAAADGDDAEDVQVGFGKLKGRWQRTDAGYQIEIKDISADGSMQAAYYNPGPIQVSEAKASTKEGVANVFIELRDVGYPGCTYNLSYDVEQDCLRGIYFQAAQQQQYPVEFVRQ